MAVSGSAYSFSLLLILMCDFCSHQKVAESLGACPSPWTQPPTSGFPTSEGPWHSLFLHRLWFWTHEGGMDCTENPGPHLPSRPEDTAPHISWHGVHRNPLPPPPSPLPYLGSPASSQDTYYPTESFRRAGQAESKEFKKGESK